jgi:hypothetical protein
VEGYVRCGPRVGRAQDDVKTVLFDPGGLVEPGPTLDAGALPAVASVEEAAASERIEVWSKENSMGGVSGARDLLSGTHPGENP